ncbi:hypothetical protein [Bacteriovorax sp. Seq25_V]|uniref:hypothetical protein n=1 Tax=Bacteriovorax sp. Seq25_V TaxID=1201288 RepID=UPI00038A28CB|nr:hypothetical protein [Bacteriovorax sp. Seq25_V]EQC46609.1 hypothetical protein M900_2395 [Bacteriovorax sp. Seq25_V]
MKKIILLVALVYGFKSFSNQGQINSEITVRNSETGIKDYDYDISNDSYSLDLSYVTNPNLMDSGSISGFRGQMTWFKNPYSYVLLASKTSTTLKAATSLTGNYDETTETLDLIEAGIGLSRRSTLINTFWDNAHIYDESLFAVNLVTATSTIIEESIRGFGMTAGYGLFYRTSKSFHWALRADYHLNSLAYTKEDTQLDVDFIATWFTVGLGMGFYF